MEEESVANVRVSLGTGECTLNKIDEARGIAKPSDYVNRPPERATE